MRLVEVIKWRINKKLVDSGPKQERDDFEKSVSNRLQKINELLHL